MISTDEKSQLQAVSRRHPERGPGRHAGEVPPPALGYVAEQVKVEADEFSGYSWSSRSIKYHREQIRAAFGFREFTRGDEDKLAGWLAEEVCPVELGDEALREAVLMHCQAERIEPPGRIDRIVGAARSAFEQRFCARTVSRLGEGWLPLPSWPCSPRKGLLGQARFSCLAVVDHHVKVRPLATVNSTGAEGPGRKPEPGITPEPEWVEKQA